MSDIVDEMIQAVRGDVGKPLNAVDRLRAYEALTLVSFESYDAIQILEYLEEAADEIERLRSERQRAADLIEEAKSDLRKIAEIIDRNLGHQSEKISDAEQIARALLDKLEGR